MENHFQKVAEAFSYKATQYDTFGEGHINLTRMRQRVYAQVERFIKPGDHILELNAGTGIDAVHFSRLGYRVHAIDISPGMLAAIADKATGLGQQDLLTVQNCSFTNLRSVQKGPFQYVFSDFGGLNCIPDLSEVAAQIPTVLVPGGRLTWVIMPPFCPWDIALVFKGEFRNAFRRFSKAGTIANVEGVHFRVHYFSPEQVLRSLGSHFHLLSLEGLSVLTPTADRKNFALMHPRLFDWLSRIDDAVSPIFPFNHWGDFFILTAEYRP